MTRYKAEFPFTVAFPPQTMDNVLAEWLAKHNIPQCHVAGEYITFLFFTILLNAYVNLYFTLL